MDLQTSFNNFDYVVLGVILLSGLLALMRGLIREVFSLVAWIGAFIAATQYYPLAEPWTQRYLHKSPEIATQAAGVVVFVIAFVLLSVTGALIAKLIIRGGTLTAIDRSLGFIFGIIRGVVIVSIVYLLLTTILWPDLDEEKKADVLALPPAVATTPQQTENKDGTPPAAPEWILKAKTRTFLNYGAKQLKVFIPEKDIESTTAAYFGKKSAAQKTIQEHAKDMLSLTPSPSTDTYKMQGDDIKPNTPAPQPTPTKTSP